MSTNDYHISFNHQSAYPALRPWRTRLLVAGARRLLPLRFGRQITAPTAHRKTMNITPRCEKQRRVRFAHQQDAKVKVKTPSSGIVPRPNHPHHSVSPLYSNLSPSNDHNTRVQQKTARRVPSVVNRRRPVAVRHDFRFAFHVESDCRQRGTMFEATLTPLVLSSSSEQHSH